MGVEAVVFYWFLVFYGPNNEAALYGPYETKAECEYSRAFGTGKPENARRVSGCLDADENTLWWPIVDRPYAEKELEDARRAAR